MRLGADDAARLLRFLQRCGAVAGRPGKLPALKAEATPIAGMDVGYCPGTGILVYRVAKGTRVRKGQVICEIIDPSDERGPRRVHRCRRQRRRAVRAPARRHAGLARQDGLPHRRPEAAGAPRRHERPGRLIVTHPRAFGAPPRGVCLERGAACIECGALAGLELEGTDLEPDTRRTEGLDRPQRDRCTTRSQPTPVAALTATLDHPPLPLAAGTPLPPLWHWLYFLPLAPAVARSAPTATRGAAASCRRCRCRGACGPAASSSSARRCASATRVRAHARPSSTCQRKDGPQRRAGVRQGAARAALQRRGRAGAGRVPRHRLPRGAAARRRAAAAAARARPARPGSASSLPDEVLLFRYSALTFNGHRIHYDRPT